MEQVRDYLNETKTGAVVYVGWLIGTVVILMAITAFAAWVVLSSLETGQPSPALASVAVGLALLIDFVGGYFSGRFVKWLFIG